MESRPIKPHQGVGILFLPPWSLAPSDLLRAQGWDKRTRWCLAWKGAHRAVALAREVVSVAQTAPLIPTRRWPFCHAGPQIKILTTTPSSSLLCGGKYSQKGGNYSQRMVRIESAGGGEALTRLIKMWSKLNTFQSGTEAQQDRVYTGDRSKPVMTKRTCDARRRVKAYRPVLSRKSLRINCPHRVPVCRMWVHSGARAYKMYSMRQRTVKCVFV